MSDSFVSLRHGGRELLRYVFRLNTPLTESPRPYAHPVRTLAGRTVTGYRPSDHPWHTGISLAVAHVSGVNSSVNFWGGPTYVDGRGYVPLDDHGVIRHDGWVSAPSDSTIDQELSWLSPAGAGLVNERRTLVIDSVNEARGRWVLRFSFRLINASGGPLAFGSPATHGRRGAGYGGLFWRGARSFVGGSARTSGGSAINGARTPWLPSPTPTPPAPWCSCRTRPRPSRGSSAPPNTPACAPPSPSTARSPWPRMPTWCATTAS